VGTPSNMDTHTDYNKHWERWVDRQVKTPEGVTQQSVIDHLNEIEISDDPETKSFKDWLKNGVQAEHSYDEWGPYADKEKWYSGKVDAVRDALAAEARVAKDGARFMQRAGKTLRALGWPGAAAAVLCNAEAVRAGEKTWEEGVHDALNPFLTAEQARDITGLGNLIRDEWIARNQHRSSRNDVNRRENAAGLFPEEK